MAFWLKQTEQQPMDVLRNEARVVKVMNKRNFLGAIVSRLTGDWNSTLYSPNDEVYNNANILRGRARDLARNNSYAANYLDLLSANVIGPEGISLNAKVKTTSGELNEKENTAIKTAWNRWSEEVSLDGRYDLTEFAKLALRTVAMDGEVFVRLYRGGDSSFGLRLQLVDADYLDFKFNKVLKNGNVIRQGIEFDRNQIPVAYHFYIRHPNDTVLRTDQKNETMKVPAEEVIHLFRPARSGQIRGLTWFHKVMYNLHMLGEAKRFELIAARVSAGKMGFIVKTASSAPDELDDLDSEGDYVEPNRTIEVGPGQIAELGYGEDFKPWNPDHPNNSFKDFTALELRGIASGLGISYSTLASDLSDQSYSAGRLGSIRERDTWKELQAWFSKAFYMKIYNAWITTALLSGDLKLSSRNVKDYKGTDKIGWKARGFSHVDPLKDLKAYESAIHLGLMDRTTVTSELGLDFDEIALNLARESEKAESLGIDITGQKGQELPLGDSDSRATRPSEITQE